MDPERVRELAQKGGRRAHELGTAHTYTTTEASEAGKKGGLITGAQRHAKSVAAKKAALEPPRPTPRVTKWG